MGDGHKSKRDVGADSPGDAGGRAPAPTPARSPASRDLSTTVKLRTREQIDAECERIYAVVDAELDKDAPRRVVGELTDRMIKILRLKSERIDRDDTREAIERLIESNRELLAALAGGAGGTAAARANAAPAFRPPNPAGTH